MQRRCQRRRLRRVFCSTSQLEMASLRLAGSFSVKNLARNSQNNAVISITTQRCAASAAAEEKPAKSAAAKPPGVQGTSFMIPFKGDPALKFPVKLKVEAGKSYMWCACGHSKKQPFCDGSHKRIGLTVLRPVEYVADKDKEVLWCQCKLTDNRPFCDGKHKTLPSGPLEKERDPLLAYDQYEQIVDKDGSVAANLGLKTNKKGWIMPNERPFN